MTRTRIERRPTGFYIIDTITNRDGLPEVVTSGPYKTRRQAEDLICRQEYCMALSVSGDVRPRGF